jgi:WhiB family redox-sensing transcriptional regulator
MTTRKNVAVTLIAQGLSERLPWASKGACKGKDMRWWFPSGENSVKDRTTMKQALAICKECDVRQQCLDYALNNESDGIWGGLTTKQRNSLRRERRYTPIIQHK